MRHCAPGGKNPARRREFRRNRWHDPAIESWRDSPMGFRVLVLAAAAALMTANVAAAKQCGNDSSGFAVWLSEFRKEAQANGIRANVLDAALGNARYATKTISLDRNQRSFKLSFEQFMEKRGAQTIINRGRKLKAQNAALFERIEARYGVPAGPLIAIWGMETAFGSFQGDQPAFPALATLAYDCRRSAFFEEHLYAALQLVQSGQLTVAQMKGAGHGEIGQMQFLPGNYLKFGVDGDGNGKVDMISSRADALASTANFLRGHGWKPGAGYQQGEPNFAAIQGWNKAGVYQRAIAVIGKAIDG
jgi:lytic murein transglycosylase